MGTMEQRAKVAAEAIAGMLRNGCGIAEHVCS